MNYAVCTLRCKRQEEEDKWPEIESMKRERNFPTTENEIVPRFFSMSGEEEISLCLHSICCFCLYFFPGIVSISLSFVSQRPLPPSLVARKSVCGPDCFMTLAKGSLSINWHIAITTACGAAVVWRRFRGGGGGGGGGNGRNSEFVFSPLGIGREAIGRRGGGETFYYCFSPLRGGGGGREQDQLHMLLCLISMFFGVFGFWQYRNCFSRLTLHFTDFSFLIVQHGGSCSMDIEQQIDKLLKGG